MVRKEAWAHLNCRYKVTVIRIVSSVKENLTLHQDTEKVLEGPKVPKCKCIRKIFSGEEISGLEV